MRPQGEVIERAPPVLETGLHIRRLTSPELVIAEGRKYRDVRRRPGHGLAPEGLVVARVASLVHQVSADQDGSGLLGGDSLYQRSPGDGIDDMRPVREARITIDHEHERGVIFGRYLEARRLRRAGA